MPLKLKHVDYSIASKLPIVALCLQQKVKQVRETNGIGAHSCCSYVGVAKDGETPELLFGNSRNKAAFKPAHEKDVRVACVHGEMDGVWQYWNDYFDKGWSITCIYIEMSPCKKCAAALANLVGDSVEIFYSFDYETQKEAWEDAATKLCA